MSDNDKYVLLDTDVFSFLMKPGDRRAEIYRKHVAKKTVAVSFITVGELLFGARKKNWGTDRMERLKQKLRSTVIVPYDYELCLTYAELKSKVESEGKSVALHDLWISACSVRHSISLVSNNQKHFEHIPGLTLISETKVVREIQSQGGLFTKGGTSETPSSASDSSPPSSRSHSSGEE